MTTDISIPNQDSSLSEWLNYMQHIHVSAIDMGLERVLPVFEYLKIRQSSAFIFTVAGTNGKGSTTATMAQICQSAGYQTALYQSPHLLCFNERIKINGEMVDDDTLIKAFVQVEHARLQCQLTLSFFEMTTLAALLIFAQSDCDVWVLEVGLGGRLDVINVMTPNLAVITNVGIDHVDWLGDTREKIGYEKAGILREKITLIYGEADMPESVKSAIKEKEVTCYQAARDYTFFEPDPSQDGEQKEWYYSNAAITMRLPKPSLSLINVSNAISAVLASPLTIEQQHIHQALTQVQLLGRFDKRQIKNRTWLFDVAHNEQGIDFLLKQFNQTWQHHQAQYPNAKLFLLFSMLADKDIDGVIQQLLTLPIQQITVAPIEHPRGTSTNQLLAHIQQQTTQNHNLLVQAYPDFSQATTNILQHSQDDDFILVCGSFHTIAEVLKVLGK